MKKSEVYYMAQIAVINAACIAPERKLQILRVLIADEDSAKYWEEKKQTETVAENKGEAWVVKE